MPKFNGSVAELRQKREDFTLLFMLSEERSSYPSVVGRRLKYAGLISANGRRANYVLPASSVLRSLESKGYVQEYASSSWRPYTKRYTLTPKGERRARRLIDAGDGFAVEAGAQDAPA